MYKWEGVGEEQLQIWSLKTHVERTDRDSGSRGSHSEDYIANSCQGDLEEERRDLTKPEGHISG